MAAFTRLIVRTVISDDFDDLRDVFSVMQIG
jgi:hypothetical protein